MLLDIVLRGQSNAAYLAELDRGAAAGRLVEEVETLLGFDGVTDSVRLVYDRDLQGGDTAYPATAFLDEWMQRTPQGWTIGRNEQGFLDRIGEYRADGMGSDTAVLWMHSEYDSRDPDLSTADWTAAVRTDAALTRATLGRDVPYLFVAAHPYGHGTDSGHQAIRAGMEQLAADPVFNARIAARAPDINASQDNLDQDETTIEYGGAHISREDAHLIAARAARVIAEEWAEYAKPGSPIANAGGNIASDGPRVAAATAVAPGALQVDVVHDAATGFTPLSQGAAGGLGWTLRLPAGGTIAATGAELLDGDSLLLRFAQDVPGGAVLDYAYGIGRVARADGPGQGNALTDASGLPVWTPAEGVAVANPAPVDPVWGG